MTRVWIAAGIVAALAAPAGAREVVRPGVPIDSLTPEGMTRSDVVAPASEGEPVRLVYTGANGKPSIMLYVAVAANGTEAKAALEHVRRGVSRTESSAERSDLGDAGFGSGRIVGFVKDNVMVVVQRIDGSAKVEDLASAALAAVEAAPTEQPGRRILRITSKPVVTLDQKQAAAGPREVSRISIKGDIVASRAVATGAGYASARGQSSWSLIRTGAGPLDVSITSVDSLLRASTHTP